MNKSTRGLQKQAERYKVYLNPPANIEDKQTPKTTREIIDEAKQNIQKEHNYTDKNLIINGRDFSKSFEVMRAEIEAKIGIKPIKGFGTNYAEHYHSGETAIAKLINEAEAHKESGAKDEYKGQVAGAFHRKELGDIDLVWGEVKGKGKEAKGYGLAKIIEKHLNAWDFKAFGEGEVGLLNAMSEIIGKGKLIRDGDRATLQYIKDDKIFKIGLKGNWKGEPTHNKWVITVYKDGKRNG